MYMRLSNAFLKHATLYCSQNNYFIEISYIGLDITKRYLHVYVK